MSQRGTLPYSYGKLLEISSLDPHSCIAQRGSWEVRTFGELRGGADIGPQKHPGQSRIL